MKSPDVRKVDMCIQVDKENKRPECSLTICDTRETVKALIDTGSEVSILESSYARRLKIEPCKSKLVGKI